MIAKMGQTGHDRDAKWFYTDLCRWFFLINMALVSNSSRSRRAMKMMFFYSWCFFVGRRNKPLVPQVIEELKKYG
jgi:hypothetical protein